jgi:triosephosphate isomerase
MLIIANWKAYVQSEKKAQELFLVAKKSVPASSKAALTVVIAPPAPYIGVLAPKNRSRVCFAAQDLSVSSGGAATGETTAGLLAELGVQYTLLGHSERRAQGETNEIISEKVRQALAQKIIPVVCVGEKERDPEAQYLKLLRAEISAIYEPLSAKERAVVILAYEPIWAIGKSAAEAITPADLTEMILYIRKILSDFLPERAAAKVSVLYGGSVEPANVSVLSSGTGISGFLLGHASADPSAFSEILKQAKAK